MPDDFTFEDISLDEAEAETKQKPKVAAQPRNAQVDELVRQVKKPVKVETGELQVFNGMEPVGTIHYPLSFCPGVGCEHAQGKDPFSYWQLPAPLEWWVHIWCNRPTLAWWSGHFQQLVQVNENTKLPWNYD